MMQIKFHSLNTNSCNFDRKRRALTVSSDIFSGIFPREILVSSTHTGRRVIFRPVQPGHRLFDEDHWDGEQAVYIPTEDLPKVECLVVYHC